MEFYFLIAPYVDLINDPVFKYFIWTSSLIALVCWIASLFTDNYSHVDRIWSILPPAYAWGFLYTAVKSGIQTNSSAFYRLLIMAILPTIWGARLTYNFWRKDGYKLSTEDYRWIHVRKMFNYPQKQLLWQVFNFTFIAFFQNYLLLSLALPMWRALPSQVNLNLADLILAGAFLFFLIIETIADQQQWTFQTEKYKWLGSKKGDQGFQKHQVEAFKRGFIINGLFAYSRHPNFFAEISIWWTYYLFSISSNFNAFSESSLSSFINHTFIGAFVLTMLFHKSTDLTERISKEKYPEYGKYQKFVSRIIPFLPRYKPK